MLFPKDWTSPNNEKVLLLEEGGKRHVSDVHSIKLVWHSGKTLEEVSRKAINRYGEKKCACRITNTSC